MKLKTLFILLVVPFIHYGQAFTVDYDTSLSEEINETSGLLFFNGFIFTINDSGNEPCIYQLDTLSGGIVKKIYVNGSSNHDWEALAQDDEFVYIGDIGNNDGNRTDLKIYKIRKDSLLYKDTVWVTDTINFVYGNQTDFNTNTNNTPFDAEAIICLNDTIILFSKNWTGNTTYMYKIPANADSCIILPYDSIQLSGMVTGADIYDSIVYICGYNHYLIPFVTLYDLHDNAIITLAISDSVGPGQMEGIAAGTTNNFFTTREKYTYNNNGNEYVLDPRLYRFSLHHNSNLPNMFSTHKCRINPNPANTTIYLSTPIQIKQITITGMNGKIYYKINTNTSKIDIKHLPKGTYIIRVIDINNNVCTHKLIKE